MVVGGVRGAPLGAERVFGEERGGTVIIAGGRGAGSIGGIYKPLALVSITVGGGGTNTWARRRRR